MSGIEEISLPFKTSKDARDNIMFIGLQHELPRVWFNVKEEENQDFVLLTIGTGHDYGDLLEKEDYIGTVLVDGDYLVWHYFLLYKDEFIEKFNSLE